MRLRVGLTGGIGSGKSEVAKIFAQHGALVIDADALAREVTGPSGAAFAPIALRFPEALGSDGSLDRALLAGIVFRDRAARDELNAIVHPAVRTLAAAREATAGPGQLVLHDVPLLFEGSFYRSCDANVLVVAERETRIARIVRRSGFPLEDIERRMAAQIDPDRARELADYTLENDGTLAALEDAVQEVYDDLLERIPTASRSNRVL